MAKSDAKAEDKKKSFREEYDAISAKNADISHMKSLEEENTSLKQKIAESAKSKRGPANAGRINGLATLKNTLGNQFSS
jgi:hypothetical protein